jgi:hypothetical protein
MLEPRPRPTGYVVPIPADAGGDQVRHIFTATSRNHRWPGSASMRGCHMAAIAISGGADGKLEDTQAFRRRGGGAALRVQALGTSAIRSAVRTVKQNDGL